MITTPAYFVDEPNNYPNKHILTYDWRNRNTDYLIFIGGIKLPAPDIGEINYSQDPSTYDLIFESEIPESKLLRLDYLPNNAGSVPLVNQRCIDVLLELCPEDFQYFPAVIRNQNDKIESFENHDYFVINIACQAQGIDTDLCEIKYNKYGSIDNLEEIVLSDKYMEEHHLARLREFTPSYIASSTLVDRFKKAKIKGLRFVHRYGD